MMRVGLIGWFRAHNVGDELALHVASEGLRRRLNCEVEALSTARFISAPHCGVTSLSEQPGRSFWSRYDALCWGPGGMLPGAPMMLQGHLPPWELPQVILSSVWTPGPETDALLQRCRLAWSRCACVGDTGTTPVIVAPDCAYGLHVTPVAEPDTHTIVVCPSARCPELARRRIGSFVRKALAEGYSVLLYPAASSPGDMDIIACWLLAQATGATCYQDVPNWQETMYIIRHAALVVTLRKHPAIMAQLLGVPSVVCDYWGVFRPLQDVSGGDSLIIGGPIEAGGEVGAVAEWLACLEHRAVGFDRAAARARVNAALDAVAEAIA